MKLLTNEQRESNENSKIHYICYKKLENKYAKYKIYRKVREYTVEYRGTAHSICNLKYNVSKEIPIVFHNGSNYDYHFIIKELTEECDGQFTGLGGNTEKYILYSLPVEKEITRIGEKGK